jgi:hypothetical protein
MQKRILITSVVIGVLLLAVGGWTVQGIRWTLGGAWLPSLRPAAA